MSAQTGSVVDQLRQQRAQARAAEVLAEIGEAVPWRDVEPVNLHMTLYLLWHDRAVARQQAILDSLAAEREQRRADSLAQIPVTLEIRRWDKTAADEQGGFLAQYREAFWSSITTPTALDTMETLELRARLNGLFGAPTRNAAAAEQEGYAGSEYVQFEYWLVVNDTIPLLVLDRDGPFGRGLLIAGDEPHRRVLPLVKRDLTERLLRARPTAYVDYYHARERSQWYRTGYDGADYFVRESRRPRGLSRRTRDDRWRIFR
ncbi:MAG: hypothetical protein HKN04_08240 [Rhodothermaceae bacterium]|nr:hypothetical protein [Rhodothermaceae bacterium]